MIRHRSAALLFLVLAPLFAQAQVLPTSNGAARAPDEWLLESRGPSWWYRAAPGGQGYPLQSRPPTAREKDVVARAEALLSSRPARVIALVDGDTIVYAGYTGPANENSTLFGFSMGKTVAAMATGKAICAGKLSLETRAQDVLPSLEGKPLGRATVRDLLRMASGAALGDPSGTMFNPEQLRQWQAGNIDLLEFVATDAIASAERGVFSDYQPGEHFAYKNTDPIVLGLMISATTGMSYAEWVSQSVFAGMGLAHPALVVQDKHRHGAADAGIRMRLEDWVRFARWVKESSRKEDCFGEFVRAASRTQIANAARRTGKLFGGYGYFIWTENDFAPGTFWASGYGGQRIAWSYATDRMVISFSNVESWMPELYDLAKRWMAAAP